MISRIHTKWTIRGLIITPILGLVSIMLGGGGHGFFGPMLLCFPAVFAFQFDNENLMWGWIILQFPAYGLIVDLTINRPPIAAKVIIGLGLLHLLLIVMGLFHIREMN